jgi:hypothetical protein
VQVRGTTIALGALRFGEPPGAARDRLLPALRSPAVTDAEDYLMWALPRPYTLCTLVFLAKFWLATAVLVPLYLAGDVAPLGIASTLLGAPAMAACTYLSWRILRGSAVDEGLSAPVPSPRGDGPAPPRPGRATSGATRARPVRRRRC